MDRVNGRSRPAESNRSTSEEKKERNSEDQGRAQKRTAQIHTHYDNLKVARDAPPEVIRAAYRTLSQKFHPDRNPGNSQAARIMAIINISYEVLSDPNKRQEHDLWVAHQVQLSAQPTKPSIPPQPIQQQAPHSPQKPKAASGGVFAHILRNWNVYGVAAFLFWIWATDKPKTPPPGPKPYQASPAPPGYSAP